MAKKPAPKKKVSPAKPNAKNLKKSSTKPMAKSAGKPASKPAAKAAKPAATVAPAKAVKLAAKAPKSNSQLANPVAKKKPEAIKPSVMSKKVKVAEVQEEEVEDVRPVQKTQSVVSMLESDASTDEPSKAEKTSKVKPVKIERGNLSDEKAKWVELSKKYGKEKAVQYKMSEKFTTMVPMQHKILGWGFILTNENDRLEVLFETGIRMLISNYKT